MADEEPMTIRVIAPATLAEGYTFDVLVDDAPYTVEVPPGGVKEGQEFEVLYEPHIYGGKRSSPRSEYEDYEEDVDSTQLQEKRTGSTEEDEEEDANATHAPTVYDSTTGAPMGRWRTKLCSCCDVLTQSTFWMAFCCTPVLIAQLVTRLNLTWNGRTGSPEATSLSYNRIVLGMMFTLAFWKVPIAGDLVLLIFYLVIVVNVGSHVRHHVRQKYNIPPSLPQRCGCHRLDDKCCMLFCGCCSAVQMARHTHDDKEYPGHGCTTTGLGRDAPHIV